MSSTSKPNHPNPSNAGVARPTRLGSLLPVGNQISQIRGGAISGSVGAGIPSPVSEISASISNAVQGSTSTVSVIFHRDPSDANFSTAKVYIRGYQGNPSWVQMGASDSSPITFVLNSTGESISIAVQSSGNYGDYPLAQSPTTGVRLPQSVGGGFGTSTQTGLTLTGTTGALVKKAGTSSLTTTNLSADVTTNNTPACTVVGIQTTPVSSMTPHTSDALRFDGSQWVPSIGTPRFITTLADGSNSPLTFGHGTQPSLTGNRTLTAASATEQAFDTYTSAATASLNCTAGITNGQDGSGNGLFSYGPFYRYGTRLRMNNTTSCRYWVGLLGHASNGGVQFATDTPNFKYAAFRYSAGTDSTIKAICATSNVAQTVVDTTVSVDTVNSQFFEIVRTSSNFIFLIDGVIRATIGTTTPAASDLFLWGWYSDNQNTNTSVGASLWWATLMIK